MVESAGKQSRVFVPKKIRDEIERVNGKKKKLKESPIAIQRVLQAILEAAADDIESIIADTPPETLSYTRYNSGRRSKLGGNKEK